MARNFKHDPMAVASATKVGILHDIEYLRDRVGKALRGDTKFLDANHREVSEAMKHLSRASDLLMMGLVPTNME